MHRALLAALAGVLAGSTTVASAAPEHYQISSKLTYPSFKATHRGMSFWRGKFNHTEGQLSLDRQAGTGTIDIEIDAASIDFGLDEMNEHARSPDFFHVREFPTIRYRGALRFEGDTLKTVAGELSLLGVTRPVTLDVHLFKCIQHPVFKTEACGADASGRFDRADFGMDYAGQYGTEVEVQIQVEALKTP